MPRAAVLGSPVAQSLSPALHRAAYTALGLSDWSYEAIECDEPRLGAFLDGLEPEWAGLSLTMPLKRVVLSHADTASDLVRAVGAANTVVFSKQGRHLENTDVGGMTDVLAAADVSDPVILGAGGTAAAALAALRELGATRATAVVRNPTRAGELLAAAARLALPVQLAPWPELPSTATTVISTVPSAAGAALRTYRWRPEITLFDVLYHPWPTPLAGAAIAAGAQVIGGFELLLHQAARQVELMTGKPAPLAAMRGALPGPEPAEL